MSDTLSTVFANLQRWSGLPKYALERRIDIFLTPYLEEFLRFRLRRPAPGSPSSTSPPRPVQLVVPEFPLRHRAQDHLTVNVDYLLLADAPRAWIFLELKTDGTSAGDDQCEIYLRIRDSQEGMRKVVGDLVGIARRTANGRLAEKYSRVLRALHRSVVAGPDPERLTDQELAEQLVGPADLPIEVVYLSPKEPRASQDARARGSAIDEFIPLRDLATWRPSAPDGLWSAISTLLLDVSDDAPLVGSRVPWMDGERGDAAWVSSLARADGAWTGAFVEWRTGNCISAARLIPRTEIEEGRREWTRDLRARSRATLAQTRRRAAAQG